MRIHGTVPRVLAAVLTTALVAAGAIVAAQSTTASAATTTVWGVDFNDSTTGAWSQSGGDGSTLTYVADPDNAANTVLRVARTADYVGIQSPTNVLVPGETYTFSMRVRLEDPSAGTADMRFVMKPNYNWIANTTGVSGSAWTTVSGSFTVDAAADPAQTQAYIGTGAASVAGETYAYLVDDLTVTTETVDTSVTAVDFNDSTTGTWTQSGGDGSTLSYVADPDDAGNTVLAVARTADYVGIQSPTGIFEPDATYTFSMRARLADAGAGTADIRFVMKPAYNWIANTTGISASGWTTVSGTFTVPSDGVPADLQAYIGTGDASVAGASYTYLLDDIVVTSDSGGGTTPDPDFVPGGAVNPTATPQSQAQSADGATYTAALTFDDGPNPANTNTLLDFLGENHIKAVFCVIGQNISTEAQKQTLRRIVAEGHVLCNHSTDYDAMDSLTPAQIETKMKANLAIIRAALGDPNAKVPFFRAPNGAWGATAPVAVSLGMQPLNVMNLISDWDDSLTQEQLTTNLENLLVPAHSGQVINLHDGGGDRTKTVNAVTQVVSQRLTEGWAFTLPVGAPSNAGTVALATDFEDGLDGWVARDNGTGAPTVAITTDDAHGGAQAALISARTSQGSGIGFDVTSVLTPGETYELSAWVKFASTPVDDVWLTLQNTVDDSTAYQTLAQFTGMSSGDWVQVTATFTMPTTDDAFLYFETAYEGGDTGNTSSFMLDDIEVKIPEPAVVQDLTPLKDTLPFPLGVAIDSRETSGASSELLLKHFDQITPENYMKPEAWYDGDGNWAPNSAEIDSLMDFASENDIRLYGHVLVWHSQTPAWFFQHADGTPLTTSEADKQILRDRMKQHIDNVAAYLADGWGDFGSATNPLVAFDVVNEVIDDGSAYADGMRRSEWYRILGEEFVDDAFAYANEAFNDTYAAAGVDHPVQLFINDYNTEQTGKRARYLDLIERLLDRGVPVDGIGNQFHVSLSVPVSSMEDALSDEEALGLKLAVTEFDVTTGTPESTAKFIDQGYYYRDAFNVFRAHADDMFSVTVWGLIDSRSWRDSNGGPLVFDDGLQAKQAYYGIVEGNSDEEPLPARQRTANVFEGTLPVSTASVAAPEWQRLPLHDVDGKASFDLRWAADHLTAYVSVDDATADAGDGVSFTVGSTTYDVARDGSGDVTAAVVERAGGYDLVASIPATSLAAGSTLGFDLAVTDASGADATWNSPGVLGTLTMVEPLSFTQVPEASAVPTIDGVKDAVWDDADVITTDKQVSGSGTAVGTFHLLWKGSTLYVYAEVADPVVDVTGSDPWIQDSVEIYVDPGNYKNGSYRYDDTQIRISAANALSFGTGDEGFQAARVDSATSLVDGGYVVEAAIDLLSYSGLDTFHGLDVQVNDATGGARIGIRNWADPTGTGYQTTSRWGVAQLVEGDAPTHADPLADEELTSENQVCVNAPTTASAGETIAIALCGGHEGEDVDAYVYSTPVLIGTGTVSGAGIVSGTLPSTLALGQHKIAVYDASGALIGWDPITIVARAGGGGLAFTGTESMPYAYLAALLVLAGTAALTLPLRSRRA